MIKIRYKNTKTLRYEKRNPRRRQIAVVFDGRKKIEQKIRATKYTARSESALMKREVRHREREKDAAIASRIKQVLALDTVSSIKKGGRPSVRFDRRSKGKYVFKISISTVQTRKKFSVRIK